MPRLSVLMSSYRSAATIKPAVVSTLRAMPRDSELVVVLDGPDAETQEVLDGIEDRRLVVRPDPDNKGLSRQLGILVDTTDSAWVARMDSDDICLPWRFAASTPWLRSHDFVFTSGIRFGEQVQPRPSYPLPMGSIDIAVGLLFYNPLFHPSMVCRREALEAVGGYRPISYGEDVELWVRAAAAGRSFHKIGVPTICYRLSQQQMSAAEGVDDRLLLQPEYRESRRALAERFHLGDQLDDTGVLRLDDRQRQDLLDRVSRMNRQQLAKQLARSPQVASI